MELPETLGDYFYTPCLMHAMSTQAVEAEFTWTPQEIFMARREIQTNRDLVPRLTQTIARLRANISNSHSLIMTDCFNNFHAVSHTEIVNIERLRFTYNKMMLRNAMKLLILLDALQIDTPQVQRLIDMLEDLIEETVTIEQELFATVMRWEELND